jgi:hypothetical protein
MSLNLSQPLCKMSPAKVGQVRKKIKTQGFFIFRQLLQKPAQRMLKAQVKQVHFRKKIHLHQFVNKKTKKKGLVGRDQISTGHLIKLLTFLFKDPSFINQIGTGMNKNIGKLLGARLYKMNSQNKGEIFWHSDFDGNRQIQLFVNLSPQTYSGGQIQIRNKQRLWQIDDLKFGDAVVMAISQDFSHRILPVRGTKDRIEFTCFYG